MADEISALLDTYHATTLWEMADAAGLNVADQRGQKLKKAEILSRMEAEYFTKKRILDALGQLDERERAVLDRLLLRGGTSSTKSLKREAARAGVAAPAPQAGARGGGYRRVPYAEGHAGQPHRRNSRVFEDVIARLTYRGLVFSRGESLSGGSTPYKLQFHPDKTLFVPEIVRQHLPQPKPIPPQAPDWHPTRVQSGDSALLLRDLYLYWDFVRHHEISLLKSGLVSKRWLKGINETLLMPDPLLAGAKREDETGRLHLLRLLLEKLDLVRRQGGQLRPVDEDPAGVPAYWSWSLSSQLTACLDAWSRLSPTEPWARDAADFSPRLRHARQSLLACIRELPPDIWHELDDILERVQDQDADFLFADRIKLETYRGSWYYSHSGAHYYGSTQDLIRKFEGFEKSFVESAVTGILHQLGIVDLGYHLSRWQAFRLTQAGKGLLSATKTHLPTRLPEEGTGKLVLQPNFQVLVIGPAPLDWLARLDLFAEREKADRGAFEYRLSRGSIYRAQKLGMETTEVLHFLEQTGSTGLPQNVRRSLEEWGAQHERIVFRTGVSLLQAANGDLLDRLMVDPQIGKFMAYRLSPQVTLLKANGGESLIAQIVNQGLYPAVSGAEPDAADDSVIVEADGTIRPIHAVPSLHLSGRLSKLAEETPGGTWKLTLRSVRRAAGDKTKAIRLLDELARLHRGELPNDLIAQIKAWGGYYGSAAVETISLIEFCDPGALDELRKLPDLQGLLTPFPADQRALAVVPMGRLPEVKEILTSFGVQVRDGLRMENGPK